MINRDFYLNKLIRNQWNGEIKVITGIRRCGKSVLLFDIFAEYLKSQSVEEDHILKLELDQRRNYKFRNPIVLCKWVEAIVAGRKTEEFYLFIDEVQLADSVIDTDNGGIEVSLYDMLNELKSYKNLDVYVTGSNSKGLSSDIATEFRGRATQIEVYPLSFEEYYSYVGGNEADALEKYMVYGGMPRLVQLSEDEDRKKYLTDLFSEVYLKDIVERHGIRKTYIMEDILNYLSSQVASLTNPTKVANALTAARNENVDVETAKKYIEHAIDSFLIFKAERFDIKGKSYFRYPNKYYFSDIGLRNARLNFRQYDPGHIMENILYCDLKRRGYSVDVGVVLDRRNGLNSQKEIDFVVNQADKRVYIQSAFRMESEEKINSELDSLMLSADFFKKIIIRADISHQYYDENGILHCCLNDFLMGRVELFT